MYPGSRRQIRLKALLLWAVPIMWLGCGGDGGTDIVLPSLSITTATTGMELDPDGYSVAVDASPAQPIGLDATLTIERLSDGQHTVALSGLASNCAAGDNPRTVTVSAGSTATAAFTVTCGATGGSITATTSTTGAGSDPDGYALTVDGTDRGAIGVNSTLTVTALVPGAHLVSLTGIATNCQVIGDNPRSASVIAGQTTQVAWSVSCDPPAPDAGTLQITTTTGGSSPDPDGYSVSVDGGPDQAIGVNATLTLMNLSSGQHAVQLRGIASNCTIGEANPQLVTVSGGSTATASFTITCVTPPPGTGSVQITVGTSGDSPDDSYTVGVDGGSQQALTSNGTVVINNLVAGPHSVELGGVAPNCTVAGDNPRPVTVTPDQTAIISFAVACLTPQPTNGTIAVTVTTTGSSLDADGYRFTIDNGNSRAIGINGNQTVENVTPGQHSVQLTGVAVNCTVSGDNPRVLPVTAGQTATVSFSVACVTPPPTSGSIVVTASTTGSSVDPDGYRFAIDDGNTRPLAINGNQTVENVTPGSHAVRLSDIAANCTVSGDNPRPVTVAAGQAATVTFSIACATAAPTLNLQISNLYITQSTQTMTGGVPLVAGRPGFLRVFVVANQNTTEKPAVRVTLRNGGSTDERTISAPSGSIPITVQEGTLGSSWNLPIEGSLIQPGLTISAEVDPRHVVSESNENDNIFPAVGPAQALTVRTVPVAKIRFVPIQQGDAAPGDVSNSNKDQLIDLTRKLYPLNGINTDVRAVYSVPAGTLQADGGGWSQLLSDLDGIRMAEGSDRTYFGIANLGYQFGIVGIAFGAGSPTALGTDDPAEVKRVIAHELGHTWNQLHTPCANPPNVDPNYPYGVGIGVYGFDVEARSLKPPSTPDIMGYCVNPWISDYIYTRVLNYRATSAIAAQVTAQRKEPALLVWGRIVNGQPVLEPAFHLVTRPQLPDRPGPYSLEATASDGSVLFSLSFDMAEVADDPSGNRHFAFAVPLSQAQAARLGSLRLTGPEGTAAANSLSLGRLPGPAGPDSIAVRRTAGGVDLEWNPSAHRMILVRDPETGEVLSFARGGKIQVRTTKATLELVASDGVHSRTTRVSPR